MTSYPLLTKNLSDRKLERFEQALQTVFEAVDVGQIANVVYQDIKGTLNSALYDAYRNQPRVDWNQSPKDLLTIANYYPYLHTVETSLAKFKKMTVDHPKRDAAIALLTEILPIAQAMAKLKDNVVKRQPKPVEDQKEKYLAPLASMTASRQVLTLLETVTKASYDSLLAIIEKRLRGFLTRFEEARKENAKLELYQFYGHRAKHYNPEAYNVVSRFVDTYNNTKPDAAELITQMATRDADDIRDAFLIRNMKKLDSIIEAKGNLDRGEVIGHSVNLSAMSGSFKFFFLDGSTFVVNTSVVWVVNSNGKQFYRTPVTFHDVSLAGGVKMGSPSEKRMNTIFVGKE